MGINSSQRTQLIKTRFLFTCHWVTQSGRPTDGGGWGPASPDQRQEIHHSAQKNPPPPRSSLCHQSLFYSVSTVTVAVAQHGTAQRRRVESKMCDSVAFCTVFTSANAPSFLLFHSFSFVIIFLSCLKLISLATNQCTALHCFFMHPTPSSRRKLPLLSKCTRIANIK